MIAAKHLSKAPIKEALIDIRVDPQDSLEAATLDRSIEGFPARQEIHTRAFGINVRESEVTSTLRDSDHRGFRYSSSDEKEVVQFRLDGYTFSRLEPYETWEKMKENASRVWESYRDAARPKGITRIATRYINILRLPSPIEDFAAYLSAPPNVPSALPQELSSFLTRVVMHETNINAVGIVSQALENVENPEFVPIVLDIDVFMERSFEANTEFWSELDKLRDFKNEIFFESITDKTARLYE